MNIKNDWEFDCKPMKVNKDLYNWPCHGGQRLGRNLSPYSALRMIFKRRGMDYLELRKVLYKLTALDDSLVMLGNQMENFLRYAGNHNLDDAESLFSELVGLMGVEAIKAYQLGYVSKKDKVKSKAKKKKNK